MKHYVNLSAAILYMAYSIWKLYDFYQPKVGPIGNGPSEELVRLVWGLFIVSMILSIAIILVSAVGIWKQNNKGKRNTKDLE